jgi:hypothetical protein
LKATNALNRIAEASERREHPKAEPLSRPIHHLRDEATWQADIDAIRKAAANG